MGRGAEAEPWERRAADIRRQAERPASPDKAGALKILVVEDNRLNRAIMTRHLEGKGFAVASAEDGFAGVEKARSEKPALILMDMGLPGLDGWEATRRLKADPEAAGIPIIGLSAYAEREDRQKALDAGCDDYVTKPVDFPPLLEKIQAMIGSPVS
jgi:two-component system cell cycle response regulator DivK